MGLLQDFSGGINTRLAPSLLPPNQAQIYTNIDNSSGSLKSILGPVSTGIPIEDSFTWYYAGNSWFSTTTKSNFVEYRDKLYISNGTDALKVYDGTESVLGITPPSNILTTQSLDFGTISINNSTVTTGLASGLEYKYKIGITSISGAVYYKDFSYTLPFIISGSAIDFTFTLLNPTYFSAGTSIKIYRESGNYYYLVNTLTYTPGITYSDSTITISNNDILQTSFVVNNYTYCYTYYDSTTGIESKPTIPSEPTSLTTSINGITASSDATVDTIRVYRLGGAITTYTLLVELSNTTITSFLDNTEDIIIAGNDTLNSINNDRPIDGLNYITEAYAMLFASKGDKLYYSDIAKPYAWPVINFIDFDATITGIGAISNGLLVFTEFKTFIVTGNSPESFSKFLLSGSQGCLHHDTIQFIDNNLLWLSHDGICISTGGMITCPSMQILGPMNLLEIYNSAVLDNVYYLSYRTPTGNLILAFDFRYNTLVRYITTDGTYITAKKDKLYQVYNNTLQILLEGDELPIEYKSPILTEGNYTNYKTYKDFYIKYSGTFNITIYLDNKEVANIDLTGDDVYNIKSLALSKGYGLEFYITGTGTISEIEYKVVGRQNGK